MTLASLSVDYAIDKNNKSLMEIIKNTKLVLTSQIGTKINSHR